MAVLIRTITASAGPGILFEYRYVHPMLGEARRGGNSAQARANHNDRI